MTRRKFVLCDKKQVLITLALIFHNLEQCEAFEVRRAHQPRNLLKSRLSLARDTTKEENEDNKKKDIPDRRSSTTIPFSLLENSYWEDERKPRRQNHNSCSNDVRHDRSAEMQGLPRRPFFTENDWGIHEVIHSGIDDSTSELPVFPSTLEEVSVAAVETIHKATEDKNFQGRISIEIDGTQHIPIPIRDTEHTTTRNRAESLRKLALRIAQRLSKDSQKEQNGEESDRPVVVYLNTIKQAMLAAVDLRSLPPISEAERSQELVLLPLGDELPVLKKNRQNEERRKKRRQSNHEDYTRGFVVVVQPTDYNDEHQPPGPSMGTIEALQQLAITASLIGFTVVLVSPRFLASPYYPASSAIPSILHREAGLQERAAFFGGREPALQPAPWLLRDFYPPVFSWIGHALSLSPPPVHDGEAPLRRYTRVSLMQSGTESWHVFGARQSRDTPTPNISYDYLASTSNPAGRPTRDILENIFDEFRK